MRSRVPNQTLDPLNYQSTWADSAPIEIEIEIYIYIYSLARVLKQINYYGQPLRGF